MNGIQSVIFTLQHSVFNAALNFTSRILSVVQLHYFWRLNYTSVFTGIIEKMGVIKKINTEGTNKHFTISSSIADELQIDQSVAHSGVCLTVIKVEDNSYTVTAIDETLTKTNLNNWTIGQKINLERCMPAHGRFDGHIVQGHVDSTATCISVEDKQGSWVFSFMLSGHSDSSLVVPKGSICINGISLTVVDIQDRIFSVAIIPYTYEHTNMHQINVGSIVNIEFDIIGKYIAKMMDGRV
jgi:riboflavin synthase